MANNSKSSGFTLLEMAIVLIVIGLIISGISAGSTLYRQAQVRSVIADFNSYQTIYEAFTKYYGMKPGDYSQASTTWSIATPINGNGNGIVDLLNGVEYRYLWVHLYLAGFIEFAPTIPLIANDATAIPGVTHPPGPFYGSGYIIAGRNTTNDTLWNSAPAPWGSNNVTAIYIGSTQAYGVSDGVAGFRVGALKPSEAFSIDMKIDDGYENVAGGVFSGATTGNVRSFTGYLQSVVYLGGGLGRECATGNNYEIANTAYNNAITCIVGMSVEPKGS